MPAVGRSASPLCGVPFGGFFLTSGFVIFGYRRNVFGCPPLRGLRYRRMGAKPIRCLYPSLLRVGGCP